MLVCCWVTFSDGGATIKQHFINVLGLFGPSAYIGPSTRKVAQQTLLHVTLNQCWATSHLLDLTSSQTVAQHKTNIGSTSGVSRDIFIYYSGAAHTSISDLDQHLHGFVVVESGGVVKWGDSILIQIVNVDIGVNEVPEDARQSISSSLKYHNIVQQICHINVGTGVVCV